jgi:thioredoxin-like negative regulator of GroEL
MKSFEKWCEQNWTTSGVAQDARADRQQYGIAWRGPLEAKEIIELLAKYDKNLANQIVTKLKAYANAVKKTIQAAVDQGTGDPNDLELATKLAQNVRVDMNRFVGKQKKQGEQ